MTETEKVVVDAAVEFHKSWNGQGSTDTAIRNLLRSVNVHLSSRKYEKEVMPEHRSIEV